jgi:hypothetical protein
VSFAFIFLFSARTLLTFFDSKKSYKKTADPGLRWQNFQSHQLKFITLRQLADQTG